MSLSLSQPLQSKLDKHMDITFLTKVIARIGYSAKCIVYCVLGILTLLVAFTATRAEEVTKKSVFQEILYTPFGSVSLTAVTVGFACYVAWRLAQGVTNPGNLDMTKPKDVLMRLFYFFSAIAYGSATYVSIKVLMSLQDDSKQQQQQVGESILQTTWGAILVGAISLAVILFSLIQFKHVVKTDFMDKFVSSMPALQSKIVVLCGRLGFACRGVVYLMVGVFFMNASIAQKSEKAGGLPEAVSTLLVQPFGPWMVSALGIGLMGFGIFCGFEGRYRKTD
ncbi:MULTISPECIES: DUF1206 domain-containing protein [unclassified Alteromonas]|uniref:DUF1206 domain-containing protein n=1 Tax=unclassified Alteromonas TaxID=2614992 RepID=UPI00068C7FE4|nr:MULTISPECIES: DUF1206 domain-containing protein [unclassified Alteromonas]